MTITDILTKVRKGETLADEEKQFLEAYDHQKELDGTAAAARKKAESDAVKAAQDLAAAQTQLKELQGKLDESGSKGKTELEKLQAKVAELTKSIETITGEKAKLVRQQRLDDVIRGHSVQFVKEVDGSIMRRALEAEFEGLSDEELADQAKVKPVIETFRARNKAVILDTSGHGSGNRSQAGGSPEERAKAIEEMTPEQRKADLKKRGVL